MSSTTPDGKWYFTGDPTQPWRDYRHHEVLTPEHLDATDPANFDSDSDSPDPAPLRARAHAEGRLPRYFFRRAPDPQVIDPFIHDMARAVARIPSLGELELYWGDGDRVHGLRLNFDFYGPESNGDRDWYRETPYQEFHRILKGQMRQLVYADKKLSWKLPDDMKRALGQSSNGCVRFLVDNKFVDLDGAKSS